MDATLGQEKMRAWMIAFFSSPLTAATAAGCSFPFEPLMKGLRLEPAHKFFEDCF